MIKKDEHLAKMFIENFKEFEDQSPEEVKAAGPHELPEV